MGNNCEICNVQRVIKKTTADILGVTPAKEWEGKSLTSDVNE